MIHLEHLASILLLAAPATAATISVAADGSADYPTIQEAIAAAGDGDIISIAAGRYQDDDGDGAIVNLNGIHSLTITAPSGGVTLDGGDAARGILAEDAGVYCYQLDFVDCAAPDADGGGGVRATDLTSNFTLISCSFTNCSAPVEFSNGGAISVYGSYTDPQFVDIEDCQFIDCSSATYGGAMYLEGVAGLTLNCEFTGGSTSYGGAIELRQANIDFLGCDFESNTATANGGAIRMGLGDLDIEMAECTFTGNSGAFGSAVYHTRGTLVIEDCVFSGNEATYNGVLHLRDLSAAASTEIVNTWFSENRCTGPYGVGGISGDAAVVLAMEGTTLCDHVDGQEISVPWTDNGGNDLGDWCCPGDINESGVVDGDDVTDLVGAWSISGDPDDRSDCDRDGVVGVADLIRLLQHWGTCE